MNFRSYKTFLLLLAFTVLSAKGFAQDEEPEETSSRVQMYAVGGANFSSLVGIKDGPSQSRLTSFNAGMGLVAMLDGPAKFVLSVEGLYSEQGTKFTGITDPNSVETLKINYINVPVALRWYPGGGDGFYLSAGPQIGFQVGGGGNFQNGTKAELKDGYVKSTVWDAVGAIGITSNGHIGVEARYQHGLTTPFVDPVLKDYRHSVIQIRVFLPLNIVAQAFGGM